MIIFTKAAMKHIFTFFQPLKSFTAFILIMYAENCPAQFYSYSNDFLNIGVGAKALAMGKAQSAVTNGVMSSFWNPAGLMSDKIQIGLMHTEYFSGVANYDYAGVALPLQSTSGTLGFSLIRFGVDNIPNTIFLIGADGSVNYNNVTSFSVADYAGYITYSQKLKEGLQVGGSLKIIHRLAGDFASSWGFGLDAGIQYKKRNWLFGITGKDITTTFNAWSFHFSDEAQQALLSEDNVVPKSSTELTAPQIILGSAYVWKINSNFNLTPEIDLDISTDGKRNVLISGNPFSIDPRIGFEAGYKDIIFLRGGVNNFQRIKNFDGSYSWNVEPDAGIGLHYKIVELDYALTNLSELSGLLYSHVFSAVITIPQKNAPSK